MTRTRRLLVFWPEDWCEDVITTRAQILKAYDIWRMARHEYLQGCGDYRVRVPQESYAEKCELERALARLDGEAAA
jgi:hypothetical protein